MTPGPKMTIATQLVLRALLADPTSELYGSEIGDAAGLMSGTVHPILARLEAASWVQSRWEDVDPASAGRPARRYYRLTGAGADAARAELARVRRPEPARLAPRPEPGLS
jgi:PadR family transcriptional regulator